MMDRAIHGKNVLERASALPYAKRDVFSRNRALTLHAQITSAGCERRRGGDGYDWHGAQRGSSEFEIFQYTLAGSGRLRWAGREHEIRPGHAMLVSIPHDHRYWVPSGGSWDFLWICLIGQEPRNAWRSLLAQHGPLIDLEAHPQVLNAAVDAVAEVLAPQPPGPYRTSALAYALTMSLAEIATAGPEPLLRHPGLARAARHCREHLAEEVSITGLARIAGLSRHHFTRSFTAAFGMGPKDYLTDQRLQHACALLRDGAQVQAAAAACGFRDPTYFCKVFRRGVGMSPGAFRDGGMFLGTA